MYQKPKGTRDILPISSDKWQYLEKNAREIAQLFNYGEIRTPTFEEESLYTRSVGESSDIVTKEMYLFTDRGNRKMSLRPEGTAGVVRAVVENGLLNDALPLKVFYIANNFRYENPQAGRFREHTQFGLECFGSSEPEAEVELINLVQNYLTEVGITDFVLHINSIGCPKCRAEFNKKLRDFANQNKAQLCADCQRRSIQNPLRMLDCKSATCQKILQNAPKLVEFLCEDCRNHFNQVLSGLSLTNINYVVDNNLVRGLDYYTKTVFEFVTKIDNKPLTISAGGRYDNLVEEIGGKATCAVGCGIGLDRLIEILPTSNIQEKEIYYLANAGNVTTAQILPIALKLRQNGKRVELNLLNRSFNAQMKYLNKIKAKFLLLIGDEELSKQEVTIKDLTTGEQKKLKITEIL